MRDPEWYLSWRDVRGILGWVAERKISISEGFVVNLGSRKDCFRVLGAVKESLEAFKLSEGYNKGQKTSANPQIAISRDPLPFRSTQESILDCFWGLDAVKQPLEAFKLMGHHSEGQQTSTIPQNLIFNVSKR